MPRKKINPKYEGGKEPNPNTLPDGENFGGYSVQQPGTVPTAGHPIPVRQYRGEAPPRLKPWAKRRRKATGR
jgi:hypothetical protein